MQQQERVNDLMVALQAALSGLQSQLWTAMPGIVDAYDIAKQSATIQGAIKPQILDPKTGKWKSVTLPLFGSVPVAWPGGGDFTFAFPLKKGDEGIVIFAKNCIDAWWENGGTAEQIEIRSHDLSDAMFVPGLRSKPRALNPAPAADKVELRKSDGSVSLVMESTGGGKITLTAPGGISLQGPLDVNGVPVTKPSAGVLAIGGALTVTGNVTAGQGGVGFVTLLNHKHPANGSPPTPGF